MQFSNGLNNPVGLWLGHLMFDAIAVLLISTVVVVVFAVVAKQKFVGLGLFVSVNFSISNDITFMSLLVVHFGAIWYSCSTTFILRVTGRFFPLICLCDGGCPSIYFLPCKIFLPSFLFLADHSYYVGVLVIIPVCRHIRSGCFNNSHIHDCTLHYVFHISYCKRRKHILDRVNFLVSLLLHLDTFRPSFQ